ncbi:2,4'-dihydroxyacetophenone dioxygenase family protein [Burkholderia anthina]|uniref:2,4'-dihydroxyacetophenone dioxygenase family protein n=1 Tax=Burkholderia anthina TaxID=179879 RepID=UPI00158BC0B2|nr:2,4'-dihydroxyacetophenone dioxygenase family protein [Burkholderia anthina]
MSEEIFRAPVTKPDRTKVPFQLPQPAGVKPEVYIHGALDLDSDENEWVPQAEGISFKPLLFDATSGYFVNILRVRKAGVLSRHRHSGTVHAFTLRGRWHYLEHDWVAKAGDYVTEPPGETHTLVVPDDVEEMMTLFHVTGGYTYVDPYGTTLAVEDVFTKIEQARNHFEKIGLGADYVNKFIR